MTLVEKGILETLLTSYQLFAIICYIRFNNPFDRKSIHLNRKTQKICSVKVISFWLQKIKIRYYSRTTCMTVGRILTKLVWGLKMEKKERILLFKNTIKRRIEKMPNDIKSPSLRNLVNLVFDLVSTKWIDWCVICRQLLYFERYIVNSKVNTRFYFVIP